MSGKAAAALAAANIPDEARAVSGMMALPLDYPPVRVADTYSADETALAQVVSREKVQWDSGLNIGTTATGRQLPSNDWGAFVFPSLLRHQVIYKVVDPGIVPVAWDYQSVTDLATQNKFHLVPNASCTFDHMPAGYLWKAGLIPHGRVLFPGVGGGRRGVWMDAQDSATFFGNINVTFYAGAVATPLPAGVTNYLTVYRWTNGSWIQVAVASAAPASPSNNAVVKVSGYYAFSLTFESAGVTLPANYGYTLDVENNMTSCFAHLPVNDLFPNMPSIGNHRILGMALLLQNEASVMNKQGNVVAMQSPPNVDWFEGYAGRFGSGSTFYNSIFNDKTAVSLLLETGLYGFKRPKGSQDFNWEQEIWAGTPNANQNYTTTAISQISYGCFSLTPVSDYLVVGATASQVGAGDCLLSTAVGVEYTTTNAWLETQTPVIAKQAFELGIASLREVEQFYENPLHIPSLMDAIAKGMQTMAPLVGFIPGIGPALAAGVGTGGQVVKAVRGALYGDDDNDAQQSQNRAMQRKRKQVKRLAELETVVADGAIGRAYGRRPRRRF